MNAGLTGLMMHLINAGDEKKRQAEYDRRQQAGEERQNRMLLAREALARQHEVERQAYLEGKQQQEEIRKSLAAQKKIDDERAVKIADVDYGLKTIKQMGNEPYANWDAESQAAALRACGGDLARTLEITADIQNGVSGHVARAKALKAQADAAKAENDMAKEKALAPDVTRRALEEGIFADTKMRLGGASPFESANSPNVVQFDPTTGKSAVNKSPFGKPDKDADLAALMGGGTNSLGGLVTSQLNTITKNPAATGFNADGSLTTPQKTQWNVPVATPSTNQPAAMPDAATAKFAQAVRDIQATDSVKPTQETIESLAEKYRREQEEFSKRYQLYPGYINQFSP